MINYENKAWFNTAEASVYTSIGVRRLCKLVVDGVIPARYTAGNKKGGTYIFERKALDKYMRSLPAAKDF